MAQWYVSIDGQQMGPYEEGVFRSYLQSGRIQAHHPVWTEGMSSWEPVSSVSIWKGVITAASSSEVPRELGSPSASPRKTETSTTPQTLATRSQPTQPHATPSTHKGAMVSLVLGLLSFVFGGPLTAVPAIVMGHKARKEMTLHPHLQGKGLATAGLVLGYLQVALFVVMLVVYFVFALVPMLPSQEEEDHKAICEKNRQMIQEAKEKWAIEYNQPMSAVPTWTDLNSYFETEGLEFPVCPDGGAYVVGEVSAPPFCSFHGD